MAPDYLHCDTMSLNLKKDYVSVFSLGAAFPFSSVFFQESVGHEVTHTQKVNRL